MEKVKYELEYMVKSSVSVLYNCLSSPSGLSEWFADDVNIKDDIYTFEWDNSEEQAKLVAKKKNEVIRFQWMTDVEEDNSECYFEFRIKIDPLTNEVALIITDYCDEDEQDESQLLWDKQITNLLRRIGG